MPTTYIVLFFQGLPGWLWSDGRSLPTLVAWSGGLSAVALKHSVMPSLSAYAARQACLPGQAGEAKHLIAHYVLRAPTKPQSLTQCSTTNTIRTNKIPLYPFNIITFNT
ncbi:MAG: hypothetical protein AAF934_05475 [Bacteroidota bacterium]